MATATDSAITINDLKIEDGGPSCKRMTITISAEEVQQRYEEEMSTLSGSATLPGFRAGRVPAKLLERRFGKDLRAETLRNLVSGSYQQVLQDEKIKVLGEPDIPGYEELKLELGEPLVFTVEVEVFPEFEIPDFTDLEVFRPEVEVADELVDEEIKNQGNRQGDMEPLGDDEPGPGVFFMGQVSVYNLEDDPFEPIATNPRSITRWPVKEENVSGVIGGIKVDNIVEYLDGKKIGDMITVETVGSENHEIAEIRGKKTRVDFSIEELGRLVPLPAEELATKLGCADEADLRARIEDALKAQVESEQREVMHRQVARYLNEKIDLDLPGRVTEKQAERVLYNAKIDMLRRNVPEYMIEERLAELREASDEQAKQDLKTHFIMEKLAEEYDVRVEEPEVNARIFQIARESGQRPDEVRQQFMNQESIGILVSQLRHEKAADCILEKIEIQDVSVEEWNKRMADEDAANETDGEADGKKKSEKKNDNSKKTGEKKGEKKKVTKKKVTKKKVTKKSDKPGDDD